MSRFRLLSLTLFALAAASVLVGCGTVMNQVGQVAARLLTQKTDDLGAANTMVVYSDKALPTASGEGGIVALGAKNWQEEAPYLSVVLFKRRGLGLWALDGEMTVDGAPLGAFAGGVARYGFLDARAPQTLTITSKQGQTEAHALTPRPPIAIASVNGQGRENVTLDLGAPLVLELDRQDTGEATDVRIALLGTTMGVKGFWDVAVVAGQDRIELPADVYAHGQGNPINTGENWLLVEEYVRPAFEDARTGGLALKTIKSTDFVPVTVTGNVDRTATGLIANKGIAVTGDVSAGDEPFSYAFSKGRAFSAPAFKPGTRLALVTFAVRAKELSQQQTSTSTRDDYNTNTRVTTTTTRTRQFARLPEVFYQQLASDLHSDVMGALHDAWRVEVIPVSQVLAEPRYQSFDAIADTSTSTYASASYGGLREIIDPSPSVAEIFTDTNGPFSFARLERLMDALGVDGLVSVTVDLEMPWEAFSLTPTLNFQVISRAADPMQWAASYYAQGTVTGEGQELTNDLLEDPVQLRNALDTAINRAALSRAFAEGIHGLVAEEQRHPVYEAVWAGR